MAAASAAALAAFGNLSKDVKPKTATYVLSEAGAPLLVSALQVLPGPGSVPHLLLCVSTPASPPSSAAPNPPAAGLTLHWACARSASDRWRPPPPGWHTWPDQSSDGGGGAWRTPLAAGGPSPPNEPCCPKGARRKKPCPGCPNAIEQSHPCALLRIPLAGPLDGGQRGIAFVLQRDDGQWLKTPSGNFHFSLDSLPVVEVGAAAPASSMPEAALPSNGKAASNGGGRQDGGEAQRQQDRKGSSSSSSSSNNGGNSAAMAADKTKDQQMRDFLKGFQRAAWPVDGFTHSAGAAALPGAVDDAVLARVAEEEPGVQRSLMHRYDAASRMVDYALSRPSLGPALAALAVWLRLAACRHLVWNKNYNVKPREISTAQEGLGIKLAGVWAAQPGARALLALALGAAGRGGSSDVGQRIRDEILAVQARNNAKGGMMEEWHQKLHNNTSPDDVVICRALLAYIDAGLDIAAYWATLKAGGCDAQRLASYDRAITSEPHFTPQQVAGGQLRADLAAYLLTLQAVHCGDDLRSAAAAVLGYRQKDMKFGKDIAVPAVPGVAGPRLQALCDAALWLQAQQEKADQGDGKELGGSSLEALLGVLVEARQLLHASVNSASDLGGRLKDVLFLDMALDTAGRTAVQGRLGATKAAARAEGADGRKQLQACLRLLPPLAETCALSTWPDNRELMSCLRGLQAVMGGGDGSSRREVDKDGAMQLVAVLDRMKRCLGEGADALGGQLQPAVERLGPKLGVPREAVASFSEEAVRSSSAQVLAQLVAALEPGLRRLAGNASAWQVISPGPPEAAAGGVRGRLLEVPSLASVQEVEYKEATVLVTNRVSGEEEVPSGVVAVLVAGGSLDVLCHAAVRARNMRVLMACCFEPALVEAALQGKHRKQVTVRVAGSDVVLK